MTRPSRLIVGGALIAIACGTLLALMLGLGGEEDERSSRIAVGPTTTVARRDLVVRDDVDGALGYDDTRTVSAAIAGTLTDAPEVGSVVRPGRILYRLDGKPVLLLDGPQPAWRRLAEGSADGADIRQLETNLVRLSYDPGRTIAVDGRFSVATRAAVERLQRALGLEITGTIEVGDVVFLPGSRRISEVPATVGAPLAAGAEVLRTTSTRRVVSVDLETEMVRYVRERQRVEVELPGGEIVTGTVTDVGRVATAEESEDGSESTPTIEVSISLRGRGTGLDQAPVTVRIATEVRRDVLSVPVTALAAVAGGGYALEAVRPDGTTRLVPVEVGTFVDGYVEVSGRRVHAGLRVVEAPE